jgi:hypothetical protein
MPPNTIRELNQPHQEYGFEVIRSCPSKCRRPRTAHLDGSYRRESAVSDSHHDSARGGWLGLGDPEYNFLKQKLQDSRRFMDHVREFIKHFMNSTKLLISNVIGVTQFQWRIGYE